MGNGKMVGWESRIRLHGFCFRIFCSMCCQNYSLVVIYFRFRKYLAGSLTAAARAFLTAEQLSSQYWLYRLDRHVIKLVNLKLSKLAEYRESSTIVVLVNTVVWSLILEMQIFIKTLTGRKQQLNFENESTVLEVKQALQEKEGIQVDQIRSCTHSQRVVLVITF